MSQIIFKYRGHDISILCTENESMSSVLQKFCAKENVDKTNKCFLCNGFPVNEELTVERIPPNIGNDRIILLMISKMKFKIMYV